MHCCWPGPVADLSAAVHLSDIHLFQNMYKCFNIKVLEYNPWAPVKKIALFAIHLGKIL